MHSSVRWGPRLPTVVTPARALRALRLSLLQKRTACAAQHFHWSSNIGGLFQETGEFDAFATIVAILRMRKR